MKKLLFLFSLFVSVVYGESPVDTTLFVHGTFFGENDTLYYRVEGKNWNSPFSVHFKLRSNGSTIFEQTQIDDQVEELFHKKDYFPWCTEDEFLLCKKRWYFVELGERVVTTISLSDDKREYLFEENSAVSIEAEVRYHLKKIGKLQNDELDNTVQQFIEQLKSKEFSCVHIPVHPVYNSQPKLFIPHSGKFIELMGY